MCKKIFGKIIPNFLKTIDGRCADGQWMIGESMTTADFWIGGVYTNYCNNPNISFAKE